VDSDVVIDHLRGAHPLPDFPLAFSVITRCELFAGREREEYLRELLAPMHEIPMNASIAERGGVLKRTVQLQTPDALIAATALEHALPLMTRNCRHFDRVPGLTLRNPQEHTEPSFDVERPAS
jgi:predicted nucleic acid-binding protein